MDSRADDGGGSLIESDTDLALDGSTLAATPPRSSSFFLPVNLTVIVPVFNEAEHFPVLIGQIERYVERPFRMLLVYDTDRDTTVRIAREFVRTRPWLELVRNERVGLAHALRTGFSKVTSGPVLVVAADAADDLYNVSEMRRLYAAGNRLVCASRYMPGGGQAGGSRLRGWLSRRGSRMLSRFASFPVSDATNSFRLYDAGIVRAVGIESRHGCTIPLELTGKFAARGVQMAEVPTTRTVAGHAVSRLSLWKRFRYSWEWFVEAMQNCRKRRRKAAIIPVTSQSTHA